MNKHLTYLVDDLIDETTNQEYDSTKGEGLSYDSKNQMS